METVYQSTSTLQAQEGICVAIRMRPLNERELNGGQHELFKCLPNNSVGQLKDGQPLDGQIYYYDKVFDANTNTSTVYEHIGTDIVKSVTSGINGTIFAYGQTSSGKTHTMLGSGDQGGVLEMAAKDIFRQISETSDRDFLLRVSFVEIYNEVIRDLLSDATDPTVAIREDPRKGVYCEATEIIITDYDSIIKALKRGTSKRTVESTAMNDTSSRSHTIFKLVVESKQSVGSDGSVLVASLNLVDLAGSESVRHTGATGQRAKEGGKINQSLLSLSRVIHALSQPGQHVSFRDSKLTRLLQSSLSGNAKMSIVCCITPAEKYLEETRSTLQFASRAKLVKTNATVNEVIDEAVQLRRLKKELEMLKERQGNMVLNDEEYSKLEAEKDALNKQLISLQLEKDKQREQIDRLRELIIAGGDNKGDEDKENESKFRRNKKHRETWCPGAAPLPIVPLTSSLALACNNNNISDATGEVGDISFNSSTSTIVLESSEDTSLLKTQLQEALLLIESKNNEIEILKQNVSSANIDSSNDLNQSLDYEPVDLRTRLLEKELRSNIENLQAMLNEANGKIASLEQELDEANITKELSESDMDICSGNNDNSKNIHISELELQLSNAAVNSESLMTKIASLEAQNSEGQQLNSNLQKMINSMEMERSIMQSELDDLNSSVNILEQNLKVITVARDELFESKAAAENNLASLEKEISMIEKMKEVAENEALNSSEKVSTLEEEIFTMKKTQESLEEEISSCHDIILDLEHKNNVANEKLASLEDTITNLKEESKSATSSLSEEEIISMKVQIQELLSEKQEYSESFAQKQARISELESEMSHADELLSEMENDSQVLRNQLHESHNREGELSKAIIDADNEATTYREQISALEQQLEGAINDMHISTSEAEAHAKLVEAFDNAQSSNQTLTSELENLTLKIEEYKKTITSMEERIREFNEPKVNSEHNANDMEISIFKGGIALTQETIDSAKRDSERLVETMRAKLGEKEAEVSRLMKINSELQERAGRAEAIISTSMERENSACDSEENLKKKLNKSQTMLDLLKSEKDVVVRKLSECEQELKTLSAQASLNEEKIRNQLQQQTEKVNKLQSTHDDNIRLTESNRAIEQHLHEMRLERDDYKNKLDIAAARIESLEKEFYEVQSKYNDLAAASNPENYNCLHNELDLAKAKAEEVCKLHSIMETDYIELQSRYKKTREEYSLIQSEWQRCDNELQTLLKEKESQSIQQSANSSVQSQLEEVTQERDYLNAELDTANTEIESLKEALNVQGTSNEQELLSLKQEKSYLSAELEKYVESMEQADSRVKCLESEIEGFKKERDDLNIELEQASQQIQELTDALIEAENLTKHETPTDNSDKIEQIESLQEEVVTIKAAYESAADRINQLEAKLDSTVEERDDLHYQIATLKKDLMNRDDSIAQLRLEISTHTVTTGDSEKDQLLAEMNTLQETNWELENRMNAIEAEAKTLREQLSDYDKASAREQELIMRAAESEMSILRTKLQDTESILSKTKDDIAILTTKCNKFEAELLEKEDAIAQAENELYNLQSQYKVKGDESSSADVLKLKEEIEVKDKRIAHLETCKLTKEQMEKIKVLKEERKKFQEDSKIMKKQLHALKKAYDDLKAGATNGDVSAVRDLADARVQLAEVTSQLETAQSVSKSLKDKLRECAKQLQEYETERAGVIDVLERHGIDTIGLVAQDTSLTEGETVIEEELADGVSKLAQKLIASQTNNQQAIASKNKTRQLEETIAQMTSEVEEAKSTRSVLEKRLETLKSANRTMREELTALTADRDSLVLQVTELESSLKSAEGKIVNSSDTVSSEVQALEEENIELMRENKELRKEASTYRLQAERTLAQLNKVAPDIASSVVGTKRALQEKENTPARPNVTQQQNSEVKTIDSVKKGFTPALDNDDVNKAKRTRTKAKPLVAAADAGENPGECSQS